MTKQVIVMRNDLGMRKGKMIAQGAHASLGVFTSRMFDYGNEGHKHLPLWPAAIEWLNDSFKKICVRVDSEEELVAIAEKAHIMEIPHCLITDNGTTEFNGVPTKTCLALGPDSEERIDVITGHLTLL